MWHSATTVINKNCIYFETESRIYSRNVGVQNLLISCLVSKNVKIKIYETIFLAVFVWVESVVFRFKRKAQN